MEQKISASTNQNNREIMFNHVTQFAIPLFTLGGQAAIAIKYPEYGLILILAAQPFWLYSSWKSYKQAGQIGMLVTSTVMTILAGFGVVNYWFL